MVEERINRWHNNNDDEDDTNSKNDILKDKNKVNDKFNDKKRLEIKKNNSNNSSGLKEKNGNGKKSIIAKCFRCGKEAIVSFVPDGIRPVYCEDCLLQNRKEKMSEIGERKKKKEEELRQLKEKGESYQIFANNKEKNTPSFLAEDIDAEINEDEEVSF